MSAHKTVLWLFVLALTVPLNSQQQTATSAAEPSIYMVVFRTPAHVRSSKPAVFHGFASDLLAFLKEKDVPIKVDPERGTIETESPMSVGSMLNIARQTGATSLLYVVVDRPMTKWIKVMVQSYDLDEKLQWSAEASDGGSLSGKSGYQKTLEKVKSELSKHLGSPGLPVSAHPSETPKPTEGGSHP